ncbi:protein SAR DEFICIENT 1-like [Senna tora]|uniref:Protein SAR DEFICIENT 1-like n=1 Tax=Senna tora TaxID=362788 RepID=A0A834WXY9_9FABA|nr:protein SAR DEFICIENT 1-like [Senna tora]
MVTKRYLDDSDQDPHQPTDKRMRPAPTRPSLASVIGEVVMVKNLQNLFSAIEPLLRRVVREEVERVMRHICGRSITRSPSLRIELEAGGGRRPRLELRFTRSLCLPIFTGSRIVDMDGKPMQVVLVDKTSSSNIPALMRVEVVVVDGDFGGGEREEWTSEEFNDHIVRERRGKRPLLVASGGGGGEVVQNSSSNNNNSSNNVSIIMRDGIGYLSGDIEFTDNSSWIRSRKFRVGVRVIMMPSSSTTDDHLRIREGITEPFVVKDHRGELGKAWSIPIFEVSYNTF